MASLEELKQKVETLAEKVTSLKKATPPNKEEIGTTVTELLNAKREYAQANNGIGVDGKPFQEPMSKAEKKKLEKAKKKAAAAAATASTSTSTDGTTTDATATTTGGTAVAQSGAGDDNAADPNSKAAQKKAAKKAEKAAKKAAHKAGGGGGAPAAAAAPKQAATANNKNKKNASAAFNKKPSAARAKSLKPMQLAYNPNDPITNRPVAALTVAVLTNTINDVSIVSDHTRTNVPSLGLPGGCGELGGDAAIARYLVRRPEVQKDLGLLGGSDPILTAQVDSWVDYALSVSKMQMMKRVKVIAKTLNNAMLHQTYVVGHCLTLADVLIFAALGFPAEEAEMDQVLAILESFGCSENAPILRWLNMLKSHPAIQQATQLAMGISNGYEAVFDSSVTMEPLMEGMNPLEGATFGNVVTRFPPEPSGYLHVGHAKAVLMNEYYARRYKGRLIVRFDDTNPSKEKSEYQESIIEDLSMLGIQPDVVSFTSDYFPTIEAYAIFLMENGLAFMDDTPQEQMQKERMEHIESKHRNQTYEECIKYFSLMCSGKEEGSKWCLRAKIDMASVNGTMRDPVIYRQNITPHHRSGDKYKAYPTYDLACPIVDSIEGVTHALRTTEYNDRDEQYQWFQTALGLRRVRIHAFARMNFQFTELSKRKLAWFVENGHVTGWDDARFPTIRGVIRRGVNPKALREFICSQGASRRLVNMEWKKFWAENKKEIDKEAKRYMAIDKVDNVKLTVTNGPSEDDNAYLTTDFLPKNAAFGKRIVRISKEVLLEKVDTDGIAVGENIVLMRWGVVKITKVDEGLEGEYVPDGDFKAAKRKITWIANVKNELTATLFEFDNLISKEKLDEDDNFQDHINPNTLASSEVIGDIGLKSLQKNEIIQLERRGFYRVDRPYINDEMGIHLFMIPDGKAKAMSGLSGKLAHR